MTKFSEEYEPLEPKSHINVIRHFKDWEPPREKAVVPKYIADILEETEIMGATLYELLSLLNDRVSGKNVTSWIFKNEQVAVDAYYYGYEVEKEPLYEVILPRVAADYTDLHLKMSPGGAPYMGFIQNDCKKTFTEQEIKSIDERYWAFRVPVEKDNV